MIPLELRPICGLDTEPAMLRRDAIVPPRDAVRRRTDRVGRPSEPSRATAGKQPRRARRIEISASVAADRLRDPADTIRHGSRPRAASRRERIRRVVYEAYRARRRHPPRYRRERRRPARGG